MGTVLGLRGRQLTSGHVQGEITVQGPWWSLGQGLSPRGPESTLRGCGHAVAWTEAGEGRVGDRGLGTTGISERRDLESRNLGRRLRGHSTHGGTRHLLASKRRQGVTPADLKPTGGTRDLRVLDGPGARSA